MKEYQFLILKDEVKLMDFFIYADNLRKARRRMGELLVLWGFGGMKGLRYVAVKSWKKEAYA